MKRIIFLFFISIVYLSSIAFAHITSNQSDSLYSITIYGGRYQFSSMDAHLIMPSMMLIHQKNQSSYILYFNCDYINQYDMFSFAKSRYVFAQIGDKIYPLTISNVISNREEGFTFASIQITDYHFLFDMFLELKKGYDANISFSVPINGIDYAIFNLAENDIYEFYEGINQYTKKAVLL